MESGYTAAEEQYQKWRWQWRRRIAIANGQYGPVSVLRRGTVLNVFTGELVEADVAIDAGRVVGIGAFPDAREAIDVSGLIIAPSFIDPHLHLESSLLWPPELARAVVPRGTGAIVTDPHEIANVAGLAGVATLRDATFGLPIDIHFTAPSCVPASPLESPGAEFTQADIEAMLSWPETVALGEMMNFPGVIDADSAIAARLYAARDVPRDGHAPGLRGRPLQAYVAAGMDSDHESIALEEAREKLALGMMVMMRQGSSEKNLLDLLPLVTDATWHRITFCSDDRDCHDLLEHGHMDETLRVAIGAGLSPIRAVQMATWNPARHWRLGEVGAVAPGYRANLVAISDLNGMRIEHTWHNGQLVASAGEMVAKLPPACLPDSLAQTVSLAAIRLSHLSLPPESARQAIELIPGQIVTRVLDLDEDLDVRNGSVASMPERDLLKIVCVERHHGTGHVGVGLVRGFGLKRGALASTIAHDAHNIVAVGVNDADILAAIATVAESQGGLAVVNDLEVMEHLPLPIAGLMSSGPLTEVAAGYARTESAARQLGSTLRSPFGQLAFLALSVIPEARITERGLLDLRSHA